MCGSKNLKVFMSYLCKHYSPLLLSFLSDTRFATSIEYCIDNRNIKSDDHRDDNQEYHHILVMIPMSIVYNAATMEINVVRDFCELIFATKLFTYCS